MIRNLQRVFICLVKEFLQDIKKYGNNGITYSDIGSSLFYDYNSKGVVERNDTAAILERMVSETKKDIPYAVIPNASSLYFDEADWITGISSESSGYMFTDESVPFYQKAQQITHGLNRITYNFTDWEVFFNDKEKE